MAAPAGLGVKVTAQDAVGPDPAGNVQVAALRLPAEPALVKPTIPVGRPIPGEVSETVAVQEDAWLTTTFAGRQLTAVDVVLLLTVRLAVPALVL